MNKSASKVIQMPSYPIGGEELPQEIDSDDYPELFEPLAGPLAWPIPFEPEVAEYHWFEMMPDVGETLVDDVTLMGLWRATPSMSDHLYHEQVLPLMQGIWILRKQIAELRQENKELTSELSDTIRELTRALSSPAYYGSLRAIAHVALLCNGRLIQDIYDALRTVSHDYVQRYSEDWKGKVKAVITLKADKENDTRSLITAEVAIDLPANASAGCLTVDGKGRIVLPRDAHQQLPLFKASEDDLAEADDALVSFVE